MRSIRRLAFVLLAFVMYSKAQGQALAIYLSEDATYRYVNASAATSIPSVPSDWADFGFDDSAWHVGQGAFGSSFGGSLGNTTGPQTPNAPTFTGSTPWSTNWDPYLRTTFTLAAPTNLTIWIAVDNGINSIHLNGVQATATFNAEGTANRWEHVLDVPAAYTQTGTNVIALQAEDHGGGTGFAMVVTEDDLAIHTQFTTNSPAFPSFDAPTPCGQIVPVSNGIPVAISFSASDPQPSQLLTLTAAGVPAGAVFSPPLPVVGTSPSTTLTWTPGFTMPTAHTMTMTVIDETGLSNQCQVVLDEVPYVDLGVVPGSLITNPVAPLVGQSTLVEVSVANSGYVTAQAEVSLYDGNPDFGGQLIGQQTGPIAFGTMTTFAVSWTPNTAGSHGLFAVVDNLSQTDNNLADNRASVSVNVGTPPDQLTVEAGEVAAWPGATVSTVVTIRNSGSAPATISGASTTSSWATLTNPPSGVLLAPGATYTLLVDVAVPIGTSGATMGSAPIGYTILVAATTATSTFSDGILVNVFDQPVSQVTVRVEDLATVAPLAGSLVTIEGVPGQLVTDSAGEVTVDLPEGLRG
ncbi:MAG: hypothetical protein KDB53_21640, partial [Planctomycetes bacterium]|nr:hypothetical protein [Planctomycetota bacterium]